MKLQSFQILIALTTLTVFACGGSSGSGYEPDETSNYLVTFTSTWSVETQSLDFPQSPHFSGLIGAVHNDKVTLWKEGGFSSPGIKQMAETGATTLLSEEVSQMIIDGTVYVRLSGGGISTSPGTASLRLTAHRDYNRVTLVSMLAPSPDWFVGTSGLSLFENNDWLIEKKVVLYAYDAGTDSGETYTAENQPSNPAEKIRMIDGYSFSVDGTIIPVGTFTFKRL